MQGQRGIIGSLPEILEFDHGSSSGNTIIDQQVCWNIMPNPAENRLADFMISQSHINNTLIHNIDQERHNLSGWSLGEANPTGSPNEPNREEQKLEHSAIPANPNVLSLDSVNSNSQFAQSSNSNTIPQNLNLNAGFVSHGDSESSSVSDTFLCPPGGGGLRIDGNDGRLGSSSNGGRSSCKRKAVEGHIGQSSMSESPGFFRSGVPSHYDAGSSLSISAPLEQVNPRLGLGLRGLASDSIADSARPDASQRNFRVRINPSSQDSIIPPNSFSSSSNAFRRSNQNSPSDHTVDFRPIPLPVPVVPLPVPSLPPQNVQPFRWNESSSIRNASSSSNSVGNREEGSSRGAARNLWEHPMFVPTTELRTSARNPTRTVASTSRTGSSSGVHPLSAPTWQSNPNPPSRSSRRLAEYVRRSLFPSGNPESGGQSSGQPLNAGPPGPAADGIMSLGVPNQGNQRAFPRSGDGGLGFPYPLRTLAAGEGRSRMLVSEQIRSVLDLMRRGESLRFEDVMILDQSVFFGVPDIHDRHRDMRLDVDNMSYEELLALEERIGNVNTGLTEETISKQLKQRSYSAAGKSDTEAQEPCSVCREEYEEGQNIGTLDCGHDYHTDCIKQWLKLKNWCPICKTTGLSSSS